MHESVITVRNNESVTSVAINGAMTIDNVGEIRGGLLTAFGRGKNVELSLEGVTDLDLTGLQLLCSAHRTSLAGGLGFSIVGREEGPVSSVAKSSGMLRHVGCADDTGGSCVWKKEAC